MNNLKLKTNAIAVCIITACIALPSVTYAYDNDWQIHIAGIAAQKSVDNDGWLSNINNERSLQQESQLGVMFDIKQKSWPVAIAYDFFLSGDVMNSQGIKEKAYTTEQHLGIRKYWQSTNPSLQYYLGGGIAFSDSDFKTTSETDKTSYGDSDIGYWIGGGSNWTFAKNWYVGVDVRYSTGSLKLNNQERDVDGLMAGLTVGYNF